MKFFRFSLTIILCLKNFAFAHADNTEFFSTNGSFCNNECRVELDWNKKTVRILDNNGIIGAVRDYGIFSEHLLDGNPVLQIDTGNHYGDPYHFDAFFVRDSNQNLVLCLGNSSFLGNKLTQNVLMPGAPPLDALSIDGIWKYKDESICNGCSLKVNAKSKKITISGGSIYSPEVYSFTERYVGTPTRGTLELISGRKHWYFVNSSKAISKDEYDVSFFEIYRLK